MGTKIITEAEVRNDVRSLRDGIYHVPCGRRLSPAAEEYLRQKKITIQYEAESEQEKPEHMTHLDADTLVSKDHPRIIFRGKLDALLAKIILVQTILIQKKEHPEIVWELEEIGKILMEMMRCDVCKEMMPEVKILGLGAQTLRMHSHNPEKYYHVKAMQMPHHTMGGSYALINWLRTQVRETEVAAIKAYESDTSYARQDIIKTLNRLSSAMHIIMCKILQNNQTTCLTQGGQDGTIGGCDRGYTAKRATDTD